MKPLIALLGLLWLVSNKSKPAPKKAAMKPAIKPAQAYTPVAKIYKGPDDSYDTVRMSVLLPGKETFEEMGIFANQTAAMKVASNLGYRVISPGTASEGIELVNGKSYEAAIKLVGLEATFGTANAVKNKLVAAGFNNVLVNDNKGGNFIARGTWNKPTTTAKLPAQVKNVRAI